MIRTGKPPWLGQAVEETFATRNKLKPIKESSCIDPITVSVQS